MRIFSRGNLIENKLKWGGIYSPIWNLPVGSWKGLKCPSGRPGGRPTNGHIFDRWAHRSTETGYREQSSLPVNRGHFQRAELSGRSTGPVDRPTSLGCVHVLCTSVDRSSRGPVDRLLLQSTGPVDRQTARSNIFSDWKLGFLTSIKSHKIT